MEVNSKKRKVKDNRDQESKIGSYLSLFLGKKTRVESSLVEHASEDYFAKLVSRVCQELEIRGLSRVCQELEIRNSQESQDGPIHERDQEKDRVEKRRREDEDDLKEREDDLKEREDVRKEREDVRKEREEIHDEDCAWSKKYPNRRHVPLKTSKGAQTRYIPIESLGQLSRSCETIAKAKKEMSKHSVCRMCGSKDGCINATRQPCISCYEVIGNKLFGNYCATCSRMEKDVLYVERLLRVMTRWYGPEVKVERVSTIEVLLSTKKINVHVLFGDSSRGARESRLKELETITSPPLDGREGGEKRVAILFYAKDRDMSQYVVLRMWIRALIEEVEKIGANKLHVMTMCYSPPGGVRDEVRDPGGVRDEVRVPGGVRDRQESRGVIDVKNQLPISSDHEWKYQIHPLEMGWLRKVTGNAAGDLVAFQTILKELS